MAENNENGTNRELLCLNDAIFLRKLMKIKEKMLPLHREYVRFN